MPPDARIASGSLVAGAESGFMAIVSLILGIPKILRRYWMGEGWTGHEYRGVQVSLRR